MKSTRSSWEPVGRVRYRACPLTQKKKKRKRGLLQLWMRRRRKNACRQWQFFLTFLALWCRFTARTHREIRVSLLFPLSKETENESQKRTTITTTTKKGVAHTLSALFLQLATSLLVLHPGYQASMCVVPNYGCWDTKEKKKVIKTVDECMA